MPLQAFGTKLVAALVAPCTIAVPIRGDSDQGPLAEAERAIVSVAVEIKMHAVNACCAGHFEQAPRVDRLP